jgi:threonine synthase
MQGFRRTGRMAVPDAAWRRVRALFAGFSLDDAGTEAEIARLHRACGYVADPHTAVGIAAARALPVPDGVPIVAMATAHPAKFPEAIERAIGLHPPLPPGLSDLAARKERFTVAPNALAAVQALVRGFAFRNARTQPI